MAICAVGGITVDGHQIPSSTDTWPERCSQCKVDHQFMIKEDNSGTARWKKCTGQGQGKGPAKSLHALPRRTTLPESPCVHQPRSSWLRILKKKERTVLSVALPTYLSFLFPGHIFFSIRNARNSIILSKQ